MRERTIIFFIILEYIIGSIMFALGNLAGGVLFFVVFPASLFVLLEEERDKKVKRNDRRN